jgi:hypothetical protein
VHVQQEQLVTGKAAEGVALQLRGLVAPPALLLLVALARHRRCLGAGCSGAAGTAGIARAEHLLQLDFPFMRTA